MFKPIKNLEDYGLIDEYGNIKPHNLYRIRKPQSYNRVKINHEYYKLCDLIAKTFLCDFDNETHHVVFKDADRNNLHVSNFRIALISDKYDKQNDATEIKLMKSNGSTVKQIANIYGISESMVYKVLKGLRLK